jgi:hypothetical protein
MSIAQQPSVAEVRRQLVEHPLNTALATPADVQVFMKHHVFAVWDFFSLLKRLQREVTYVETPWLPRPHADHGRFIMEIVLGEETDEDPDGGNLSHFELYRRAMAEVGADGSLIDGYLGRIRAGEDPLLALDAAGLPSSVRAFVGHTLEVALHGQPHEVAASFCHGRENLLPDVLGALRDGMGDLAHARPVFSYYLDRHITLDHDEHGPLALRLLASLCDGDARREAEAEAAGVAAIDARIALWDGVLAELREGRS